MSELEETDGGRSESGGDGDEAAVVEVPAVEGDPRTHPSLVGAGAHDVGKALEEGTVVALPAVGGYCLAVHIGAPGAEAALCVAVDGGSGGVHDRAFGVVVKDLDHRRDTSRPEGRLRYSAAPDNAWGVCGNRNHPLIVFPAKSRDPCGRRHGTCDIGPGFRRDDETTGWVTKR